MICTKDARKKYNMQKSNAKRRRSIRYKKAYGVVASKQQ